MRYIALCSILFICGCVGYQNVRIFERIDGEMVKTKQIKASIWGTSGQAVSDKDISIKKNDATDAAIDAFEAAISGAKDIVTAVKPEDVL